MSSLKDRIYNYEVTPPAGAWEKIAINLDEAELANKFPERLYNAEAAPPAKAWEKINASLNPETVAIPLFKRITPFIRYAAAAVFIGVIALGIIKFTLGSDNDPGSTALIPVSKDSIKPGKNNPAAVNEAVTTKILTDPDDVALEQSKKLVAKLDRSERTVAGKLNARLNRAGRYPDNQDTELAQSIYAYEDHVPDLADRYVMLMTPDGNIIRMAKKWSDLLCCVSGEEQDADCKDQLKKWQQKMAASSLAPSPGNFMDILGLVNSLNENIEL